MTSIQFEIEGNIFLQIIINDNCNQNQPSRFKYCRKDRLKPLYATFCLQLF